MIREKIAKILLRFVGGDITEAPKLDPKATTIKKIGLTYSRGSSSSNYTFEEPEGFDFDQLQRAYLTDSYVRQAMDKYSDFMLKAGWDFAGKNQKAVDYIRSRFRAMSLATKTPTEEFFNTICDELVKYHNVFIVKAWATSNYKYPGGLQVRPGLYNKTIAGYYVLPTGSITIARDVNGKILKYQQTVPSQTAIEFAPDDIIHISIDKQPGRAFGYPPLAQVIDDVKILRQLEELVYKMVFKHINPLVIYTVGLPTVGLTADDDEIAQAQEDMNSLLMDGGIVVPERHKLETLKVTPMQAKEYLTYFENRVFTGLGMSGTIMGRGDTSNRSTSDNLDQMFKDKVKSYQKSVQTSFDQYFIMELLYEGGFDPISKPEDMVYFYFKEIDLQSKMAEENHAVQLFAQNAITHPELRAIIGREPLSEEELELLYYKMIKASEAELQAANNAGANKNEPSNQYGKRPAAKTEDETHKINENIFSFYKTIKTDVIEAIRTSKTKDEAKTKISLICGASKDKLSKEIKKEEQKKYIDGFNDCKDQAKRNIYNPDLYRVEEIHLLGDRALQKNNESLINKIFQTIDNKENLTDVINEISPIFEAREYKIRQILKQQANKARNYGFKDAALKLDINKLYIKVQENSCEQCRALSNKEIDVKKDNIPPIHIGCDCKLIIRSETNGEA